MPGRVLVVGLERSIFKKMEPLLSRSLLEVDHVARGEHGLLLAQQAAFELLVVRHPLPDMALGSFMSTVHEPGALCAATPILVLTDPERLDQTRAMLPGGVKQALSVKEPAKLLQEMASRLLGVSPRVAARIPVRLDVRVGGGTSRIACQSENVSANGLLLRCPGPYEVGTRMEFEYTLPGELRPVRGEAEVVRQSVPDVEGVEGVGLKVVSFKADGKSRVQRFVKSKDSG